MNRTTSNFKKGLAAKVIKTKVTKVNAFSYIKLEKRGKKLLESTQNMVYPITCSLLSPSCEEPCKVTLIHLIASSYVSYRI